jgi:pimeloyl-ACP methyl ester carboxylesterase
MAHKHLLGAAAALALAGAAVGWRARVRADEQAVAADPEQAALGRPLVGTPVAVESGDGTILHAEVFGPPDRPTIVLIHGWVCSLELWQYQIADLAGSYRLVAYDLRGHARSQPATGLDYSMDALAADLDAVLRVCVPDGQRAVAAGHSMGAMSVVAWAGAHPDHVAERLAGVMLLNVGVERLIAEARIVITAGALSRLKQLVGSRMLDLPLPAPRRLSPVVSRVVRYVALSKGASPAQVAFCVRMFLGCRPDVRAAFGATLAGLDLMSALDALVVPAVVVAGELDRLTPPVHARAIADALPEAHLVELSAIGHTSPLEAHAEVTGLLHALADQALAAPRESLAADG